MAKFVKVRQVQDQFDPYLTNEVIVELIEEGGGYYSAEQERRDYAHLINERTNALREGPHWFTPQEALAMKMIVVSCSFDGGVGKYDFLAPADIDIEKTPYAVVPSADLTNTIMIEGAFIQYLKVVKMTNKKLDAIPNENLKAIVAAFSLADYNQMVKNKLRRAEVLKNLEAMSKEANQVDTLKRLLGDKPEAKELLAELDALSK